MEPGNLKVYCAGSMRGGGFFRKNLDEITKIVEELGHMALTEASKGQTLKVKVDGSGDQWIYDRDIEWLARADCLIAEVSSPSLGVGYEIAVSLHEHDIKVLAVYHESVSTLSAMIHGNTHSNIELRHYSNFDELEDIIKEFLSKITVS